MIMASVLVITGLVLILFFIMFIRPARAEQRRRRRDLNALRVGDEVLTSGGLIAVVVDVRTPPDGHMVIDLELARDVIVRARTEAIAERLTAAPEDSADDDDGRDDFEDDEFGEPDDVDD
jgi:preprotein translocase subunit YajC